MEYLSVDQAFVDARIPRRAPESSKDDYGRVLALCGCRGYTGAAYLAAQAAVRTGCGVLTLCVPEAVYHVLAAKLAEPVVRPVRCDRMGRLKEKGARQAFQGRADAALIGCGLGRSGGVEAAVRYALSHFEGPLILDADGINALAGHINVLHSTAAQLVLTPHPGELRRLLGDPDAGEAQAAALARETGAVVLLKGHRTVICAPDGTRLRNTTGNPGMAKGGSGDVLAGVILSLLGQGLSPLDAAACGAFLHGAAGDRCANARGEYGMTPSDMLEALPAVLRRYNTREW